MLLQLSLATPLVALHLAALVGAQLSWLVAAVLAAIQLYGAVRNFTYFEMFHSREREAFDANGGGSPFDVGLRGNLRDYVGLGGTSGDKNSD